MATTPHKLGVKGAAKSAHKSARPEPELSAVERAAMIAVEGIPQFHAVRLDSRYVPARLPTGKVMDVWGDALIRTPDGGIRQLHAGDQITKGDVILTAQNGIVQMEADGSRFARQPFGSDPQGPMAQVQANDAMNPSPGLGSDDLGSLADGLRIGRVVELAGGQNFDFQFGGLNGNGAGDSLFGVNSLAGSGVGNQGPNVDLQSILVPESGVVIASSSVQAAAVAGTPGFAVFTVHLDIPAVEPVPLNLTLTPITATVGNAAQGGDFGVAGTPFDGMQVSTDGGKTWVAGNTVTVPVGQTQALVRVPVTDDAVDEFDESFSLTATRTVAGVETLVQVATATIVDNDPAPTVSSGDVTVAESSGKATITLTLSAASGKPVSVDWSTVDGTGANGAIAGQDYVATGGTVTFAPGETSKTVEVSIINDMLAEPTEFFSINLSNGVNVDVASAHTVSILDNDHAPTLVHQTPAAVDEDVVQTGNVLTGASDADGDPISIISITVDPITVGNTTFPGQTAAAGQPITVPGVGTIVIDQDGNYTFTPVANYDGPVPPIHYTASDSANSVSDTIQLVINPVNDAPIFAAAVTNTALSEEGLPGGLPDLIGTSDTTNATSRTGQISVTDVENNGITLALIAPDKFSLPDGSSQAPVTTNGLALTWLNPTVNGVADTHTLLGRVDGKTIVSATIDDAGNYKVDLLAPIDHVGTNVEDALSILFGIRATDNGGPQPGVSTATLAISVEDDAPQFDQTPKTGTVQTVNTNLMVVLDTSGSMSTADGISTTSRLESAVNALKNMITRYDLQGEVQVRLVTFATTATDAGKWMTVAEAQATLDAVLKAGPGGESDYHNALAVAQNAFSTTPLTGAQNISYFLSDGAPTSPIGSEALTTGETDNWTNFVTNNLIKSVAIGIGADALPAQLDLIAYDGTANVAAADTKASMVTNVDQLDTVIAGTVPAPLSGYLAGASAQSVGGADGGYISHVTIGGFDFSFSGHQPSQSIIASKGVLGTDYTYDPTTHLLVINTPKGGHLSIDMDDGKYGYEPPAGLSGGYTETVNFVVSDRDGDTLGSSLDINVPTPAAAGPTVINSIVPTVSSLGAALPATTTGAIEHATPLADVFHWGLADAGAPGVAAITHITGFASQSPNQGGDTLDLRDLLTGELAGPQGTVGNLGQFLDFSINGAGAQANTTLLISSHGGFSAAASNNGAVADTTIVLDGVDLRGSLGLDAHASNQQIIESMLQQGKLLVDGNTA
ncbi:MAG: hypothetical protein RIQ60_117 [Pseudomonadota bacterium]|jgi:hypothetical protein